MALGCLLAAKAWRTAGWTAQKKPWIWPWGSFCLRGWALRIDAAWGLRGWAFRDAFAEFEGFLFKGFKGLRGFRGFRGLGAGKRQAWTPIRSH